MTSHLAHAGQINDSMAENMELQAAAEGANAQCHLLEGQAAQLQTGVLPGLEVVEVILMPDTKVKLWLR